MDIILMFKSKGNGVSSLFEEKKTAVAADKKSVQYNTYIYHRRHTHETGPAQECVTVHTNLKILEKFFPQK